MSFFSWEKNLKCSRFPLKTLKMNDELWRQSFWETMNTLIKNWWRKYSLICIRSKEKWEKYNEKKNLEMKCNTFVRFFNLSFSWRSIVWENEQMTKCFVSLLIVYLFRTKKRRPNDDHWRFTDLSSTSSSSSSSYVNTLESKSMLFVLRTYEIVVPDHWVKVHGLHQHRYFRKRRWRRKNI